MAANPVPDVCIWHFGDMTKYANEGHFQPGSGHSFAGPSRARLWVHGLVKDAHASMGAGRSEISNRRHTKAKPRGWPTGIRASAEFAFKARN